MALLCLCQVTRSNIFLILGSESKNYLSKVWASG